MFQDVGVQPKGFCLPRQHSLVHYRHQIEDFGAPVGLCTSITESCHITAVKKPWHRSNHHDTLGQMLLTNERLDKLAAMRSRFVECGMLPPDHILNSNDNDPDKGPVEGEAVLGHVALAQMSGKSNCL